jgi:hypothetical protein
MSLQSPGAVLLLEARPALGARRGSEAIESRLREAKRLLDANVPAVEWSADAEARVRGRVLLADAARAFPMVHDLRTMLRADPGHVPIDVLVGIGAGNEKDGLTRATRAMGAVLKKRGDLTRAVTDGAEADVVLVALCRAMDALISGWTDAQWQAIHRRDRGRTLEQIGQELGIAYQNVSKRLIAARYSLYRDVLGAAGLVFSGAPDPARREASPRSRDT